MNYWEMKPGPARSAQREAYHHDLDQKWLSEALQRNNLPFPEGLTATRDGDKLILRCGNRTETLKRKNVCGPVLKAYIHSFCTPAPASAEPSNPVQESKDDRTIEGQ